MKPGSSKYFLPYQMRWLHDNSKVKIWEKSRRIGATYVQSYEDVRDAAAGKVPAVWFSSADESAAKEYILYCEQWAKLFDRAARSLGQQVLDSDKNIKTFVIEFSNGRRINALSSNPKAFRSKGGKVVLDEFAFHDDPERLWAAARPVITWGFPLRILSTHNGKQCRYYKFIEAVNKGRLNWAHHFTPLELAVEEGLVDKIYGRPTTPEEKAAWIKEQHDSCADEDTWQQEYCCIPVDAASAFLTYELIGDCELPAGELLRALADLTEGDLFLGGDIGRKKDLTVFWLLQKLGRVFYTRQIWELERMPFQKQREILFEILKHPRLRRACIDNTGLGMQLVEEAQDSFGKYRVEGVTFNGKVKEDLAYNLRTHFEDRTAYIPDDYDVREDLHSVKKITTAAGNIRFDVAKSDTAGHADRFWALALALSAGQSEAGPIYIASRGRRASHKLLAGY